MANVLCHNVSNVFCSTTRNTTVPSVCTATKFNTRLLSSSTLVIFLYLLPELLSCSTWKAPPDCGVSYNKLVTDCRYLTDGTENFKQRILVCYSDNFLKLEIGFTCMIFQHFILLEFWVWQKYHIDPFVRWNFFLINHLKAHHIITH
jgi:hypothetical protein